MPPRPPRAPATHAGLLAAALLALASCSEPPTGPAPVTRVHRAVTAVVRDEAGAPVAGAGLAWTAQCDSAGVVDVRRDESDADGEARQVLAEGGWRVVARSGTRAAGASLVVPGAVRDPADTQLVRLTLREGSRLQGTVTLAARTDHSGTVVTVQTGDTVTTGPSGAWSVAGVPLGRWTVTARHPAFRTAVALVQVVAPGSVVTAPAMVLVSSP